MKKFLVLIILFILAFSSTSIICDNNKIVYSYKYNWPNEQYYNNSNNNGMPKVYYDDFFNKNNNPQNNDLYKGSCDDNCKSPFYSKYKDSNYYNNYHDFKYYDKQYDYYEHNYYNN